MTTPIKHLAFKGIEKKEQILFKSFLNLSKNELAFQIVILKKGAATQKPDILIADEHYDLDSAEISVANIVVGSDINETKDGYIARPVQWSDFKTALSQLNVKDTPTGDNEVERVLPDDVKFALPELDQPTEEVFEPIAPEAAEAAEAGLADDDYQLDNMSVDYHSVTNSDYAKAAEDVIQFKEGEKSSVGEPLIMFTDDESASVNSVLVIETNSLDAWDFSEAEVTSEIKTDSSDITDATDFSEEPSTEVVLDRKVGFDIQVGEMYWQQDNEIIVEHESLFCIKPERGMLYSIYEPGKWPQLMQHKTLTKLPLTNGWRPKHDQKSYPIADLIWVNTLVMDTQSLADDLDPEQKYMLESWPNFDLIQLDNTLLKLCTMLFVRGETVAALSQKSGYGLPTVYGLVNACHQSGLIKRAEDIELERLTMINGDASMLGKIKDVFR